MKGNAASISVAEAVQWAEEHLFDRNSVVLEYQVWQEALGRSAGEDFSLANSEPPRNDAVTFATQTVPASDQARRAVARVEIVQTAKEGVGDCRPLVPNHFLPTKLDDEQRKALDGLLGSTNLVSVFRGSAGTGQSFVLHELVNKIQQSGRRWLFSRRSVSKSWIWKGRLSVTGDGCGVSHQG